MLDLARYLLEFEGNSMESKEDRGTNGVGALGFALGLTTLIFLFGAANVRKEFPIYLAAASCFGVPSALIALVCSIVGCLRKGRSKVFSVIGVGIGILLVLAVLPAAFTLLKTGE